MHVASLKAYMYRTAPIRAQRKPFADHAWLLGICLRLLTLCRFRFQGKDNMKKETQFACH